MAFCGNIVQKKFQTEIKVSAQLHFFWALYFFGKLSLDELMQVFTADLKVNTLSLFHYHF